MKNVTLTEHMMQHRAQVWSIKHINHAFVSAYFLRVRVKLVYPSNYKKNKSQMFLIKVKKESVSSHRYARRILGLAFHYRLAFLKHLPQISSYSV